MNWIEIAARAVKTNADLQADMKILEPLWQEYYNAIKEVYPHFCTYFERCEITENGFTIVAEFNDSCHCHPDYREYWTEISLDDISMGVAKFAEKLQKQKQDEDERRIKAELEKKKAEKARKEELEKKTLKELQAKYGVG